MPLTYYRGCWHVISRGLFLGSCHQSAITCQPYSSPRKELYNLSAFIVHAASLRQAFAHCGRFLAAASRRSLGRVSVPVWPSTLSGRLLIVALVGHYPTNKLMRRRLICVRSRSSFLPSPLSGIGPHPVLPHVSIDYPGHTGRLPTCYSPVRHSQDTEVPLPFDLHA